MSISVFGSIGGFIKKTMSASATGASAIDYSMRTLETQAFLMNVRSQSEALSDATTLNILQNYLVTEGDSENIQKIVAIAKLKAQQVQSTNVSTNNAVTASNLIIH